MLNKPGLQLVVMPHTDFQGVKTAQCGLSLETNADKPWTINTRVRLMDKGYTEHAYDCNPGIITNGRDVTTFHLESTSSSFARIRRELTSDIVELRRRAPNTQIRAVLTGGTSKPDKVGNDSRRMYRHISNVLNQNGLAPDAISRLWGGNKYTNLVALPSQGVVCLNFTRGQSVDLDEDSITRQGELRTALHRFRLSPYDRLVTPSSPEYPDIVRRLTKDFGVVINTIGKLKFRIPA